MKALVDGGAEKDIAQKGGWSALSIAAQKGFLDIVTLLADDGAQIEALLNDGSSPLLLASEAGQSDVVRFLLRKGALANKPRNDGLTPLITASIHGHQKVVKRLLKQPVDRLSTWRGKTALDWAKEKKHTKIITLLKQFEKDQQANNLKNAESSAKLIDHLDHLEASHMKNAMLMQLTLLYMSQKSKRTHHGKKITKRLITQIVAQRSACPHFKI